MDDLIVKYLTDKLDADDVRTFVRRLGCDPVYRGEFEKTVIALAFADLSLGCDNSLDPSDTQPHEPVADETK